MYKQLLANTDVYQFCSRQEATNEERPYDPKNYLLPGATRTSGIVNPNYESTYRTLLWHLVAKLTCNEDAVIVVLVNKWATFARCDQL
jgi:hypothetical protein